MIALKSLCDTCRRDKCPGGCEFACVGVEGWDEENEVVTSCQDYVEDQLSGYDEDACERIPEEEQEEEQKK